MELRGPGQPGLQPQAQMVLTWRRPICLVPPDKEATHPAVLSASVWNAARFPVFVRADFPSDSYLELASIDWTVVCPLHRADLALKGLWIFVF